MEALELYVDEAGSGAPLVLAHGFGGSARNFRPQQRAFAGRRRVVAYDARGHARSPAPEDAASYTLDALVSDLAGVVERAGTPAVVGGLSLGAYTALRYALTKPPGLEGIVLAAFPTGSGGLEGAGWATRFADAIEERGLDAAGAEFVWGEASRFDPKGAALIRAGILEHPPHALAKLLRQVLAKLRPPDDFADELRALDVPALVVAGSNDAPALAPSQRLVELLPNAELVVVPDAGHVVNLATPTAFNAALTAFLDRLAVR